MALGQCPGISPRMGYSRISRTRNAGNGRVRDQLASGTPKIASCRSVTQRLDSNPTDFHSLMRPESEIPEKDSKILNVKT